jgi:hypothetical protein
MLFINMSLWIIILLLGFIFLLTYNPKKGTIHKRLYKAPPQSTESEEDPLKWKPTSGMYDPVGAIFGI